MKTERNPENTAITITVESEEERQAFLTLVKRGLNTWQMPPKYIYALRDALDEPLAAGK
jgi:hypothetical protein